MAEVLVLVDHVEGTPKKVSYELLTLARTLGTPSAVVLGKGASNAAVAAFISYLKSDKAKAVIRSFGYDL